MNTLQAYRMYTAVRLHFTDAKYDIRKTKGRVNIPESVLAKKPKIQYQIQKLLRKFPNDQFMNYCVANAVEGDRWAGLYDIDEGSNVYFEWQKRQDSLSYTYKQEVETLRDSVNIISDIWDCSNTHPVVLKSYLGKKCCLETVVILNKLYTFNNMITEQLIHDPVWSSVSLLVEKYSPFVQIDKEKYLRMTEQAFA